MNTEQLIEKHKETLIQLSDMEKAIESEQPGSSSYRSLMRDYTRTTTLRDFCDRYLHIQKELENLADLVSTEQDADMKEIAKQELEELRTESDALIQKIQIISVPPDPLDDKNVIVEIRAGTGGEEAALFAEDVFRMYSRYAETKGWRVDILQSSESDLGGFREVIASISGDAVFSKLKHERGVHRVQRVPTTESSGRIHTSAITVAILPEADETEVEVKNEDLRIDVFRSSGPGGQSVNTTDSAVRITHVPTSLVVICQDEKSQHKNKEKAMRVLKARLYELEESRKQEEAASSRKQQIGTGDRSERVRTYNFPQNRLTDHRINLTLYRLDAIIEGDLDMVIEPLILAQSNTIQSSSTSS